MEGKIAKNKAAPTAPMRSEVQEDITNVRTAVDDLKTTTPENWWERHERAIARSASDIEEDVRRLTGSKAIGTSGEVNKPATPAAAVPFESRRDQFVDRLRIRLELMENSLKDLKARNAEQTEIADTRARIEKLKDDVDRLKGADSDDWWDISYKRVSEYVERVDDSVRRLDNDKPARGAGAQ
jgi:hypothetical protein